MEVISKVIEYIKKITVNQSKKKLIENAVIVIIIGIIAIIAGSSLFGKGSSNKTDTSSNSSVTEVASNNSINASGSETESRMEAILSQINGAGRVNVMITYESEGEKIPAYDTKKSENNTQEKDSTGGTRDSTQNSNENSVVYEEDQGGTKKPVILKEITPDVKGVLVVADGADDPSVKEEICNAVAVLLDVPIYKIQVLDKRLK